MSAAAFDTTWLRHAQLDVLVCLAKHGQWHRGCGWLWATSYETRRILESLERRGLAVRDEITIQEVVYPRWKLSADGALFLQRHRAWRRARKPGVLT